MTCDCLQKCIENRLKRKRGDQGSRRAQDVHKRLIHQAPNFLVPLTRVDLRFWKKAEDVLKEKLDTYNYYPFGVVSPFGIYRLQYTQSCFWFGIGVAILFIAAFIGLIIWTRQYNLPADERDEFEVDMFSQGQFSVAAFSAIFLFLVAWWMGAKSGVHSLYLDCQSLFYEVYRGDKLLYRGHFHNIYIRLKCLHTVKDRRERDKADAGMYYLILNGSHISPIYLSSNTRNFHELRKYGKRIATNFNINFVDIEPVSKHHQIRHRCPYGVVNSDDDGFESIFDVSEDWTEDRNSSGPQLARRTTVKLTQMLSSKANLDKRKPGAKTRNSASPDESASEIV